MVFVKRAFLILFFSCREKKDTEVQVLESSKDVETDTVSELAQKNEDLREKISTLKNRYTKVLEFAKKNNISLKPRGQIQKILK